MEKLKAYLAGPMKDCTPEEMSTWRNRLKVKYAKRIEFHDPVEFETKEMTSEQLVDNDIAHIEMCSLFIGNVWKFSGGTMMEVVYAWKDNSHVILMAPKENAGPWLKYHSDEIVHTEEDLDKCIERYLEVSEK